MDDTQLTYFVYFIAGAITTRLMQGLLSVIPSYQVFKFTEYYCVALMTEIEIWRHQALAIVKLAYEEAGRGEEFEKVERKIHEKYFLLQGNVLGVLKSKLPYKINYDGILDGYRQLKEELKDE